jgi:hypothetical protein
LNDEQGQAWFEAARNVFDRLDGGQRRASVERSQNFLEALKAIAVRGSQHGIQRRVPAAPRGLRGP